MISTSYIYQLYNLYSSCFNNIYWFARHNKDAIYMNEIELERNLVNDFFGTEETQHFICYMNIYI